MIKLFNSLTKTKDEFVPSHDKEVGLYTCGPTVYNFAHIGNLRTYIFEDFLKRALKYNGYEVKHVMNITDVGHLTGDRDMGEDKLEKGSAREGKTAWEIAEYYTKAFQDDIKKLNIKGPDIWCKATDYIQEQIDLVKILEQKGFTYKTSDGIYFDTSKFPGYAKLSHKNLEELKEGARVEINPEKKNPTDFALWKFSPQGEKRQMEWGSPWGIGFPGWHIECSAMSLALLSGQLDIHCGGVDHIDIHHTNEIAQSEAATGKPFFNYWMHGAFLVIEGGKKMAKSEDNFMTLKNAFIKKNLDPLVFRFAAMNTHYRKQMEYSPSAVATAVSGLEHLYNQMREIKNAENGSPDFKINAGYKNKFMDAVNDDLNMPKALAVLQELLKSGLKNGEKLATALDFDKILGLNLDKSGSEALPQVVAELVDQRNKAREEKNWEQSDKIRNKLENMGYTVEDAKDGMRVYKK
jgi:cysteinyl-tRNA synthetase